MNNVNMIIPPGNLLQTKEPSMESIKVAIRVRPFLKSSVASENTIYTDPDDDRKIKLMKSENCFEGFYDKIFTERNSQEDVYTFVREAVPDVFSGINSTIFTYGQTGSGKTYTMFGSDWTLNEQNEAYSEIKANLVYDKHQFIRNEFIINPFSKENGIAPKIINQIFNEIETGKKKKLTVYCSFLQIYNEKIYDLLEENPGQNKQTSEFNTYSKKDNVKLEGRSLNIREDKLNGIYVEDLTQYIVENVYECLNLLKKGEKNRKKRCTKKNEMSSRSHTVFMFLFEGDKVNKDGTIKKAKLHLCDLAGSEKNDKEENHKSLHFNEMVNINLSLGTLGKVIHALTGKQSHIPYRDSKLTRLLQDSLGGNTRTYFIANISPEKSNFEETLSTLKFADRAKSVFTKVKPNEVTAYDENLINKLTKEINELKSILAMRKKRGNFGDFEDQMLKLKEENEKLKLFVMANLTKENIEKLISENKILKLELQKLRSKNEFYVSDKEYRGDKGDHPSVSSKVLTSSIKSGHELDENAILRNIQGLLDSDEEYKNLAKKKYQQIYDNPKNGKNNDYNLSLGSKNKHTNPSLPSGASSKNNYSNNLINGANTNINYTNKKGNHTNKFSYDNFNDIQAPGNKLVKNGLQVLSTKNNTPTYSISTSKDSYIYEMKELKAANERLKFLEGLERKTGLKMVEELEKLNSQKEKKKEEQEIKRIEREKNIQKMEGHIKRLNYLYKGENQAKGGVVSDYLIQSIVRGAQSSPGGSKAIKQGQHQPTTLKNQSLNQNSNISNSNNNNFGNNLNQNKNTNQFINSNKVDLRSPQIGRK